MANKQDSLYDPNRRDSPNKPDAAIAKPSVDISAGTSADPTLIPGPPEGETLDQAVERIRALREKKREEWGDFAQKLALPKRPGYHTHWFNDVAGRIDEALASGWAHRTNPRDGKPHKRTVGVGRDNNPLVAYAMDLPLVFWEEEMAARHQTAAERINAIKKNPFAAKSGETKASDQGKFYSPTEAPPLQVIKG